MQVALFSESPFTNSSKTNATPLLISFMIDVTTNGHAFKGNIEVREREDYT